jgi:hypothetical protein
MGREATSSGPDGAVEPSKVGADRVAIFFCGGGSSVNALRGLLICGQPSLRICNTFILLSNAAVGDSYLIGKDYVL